MGAYDGDLSLPLGLALGSPIFPSGCEGKLGVALESLQGCATPQLAAHQAPPSLGFSRKEHWATQVTHASWTRSGVPAGALVPVPVKSGLGRGLYDHGYPSEGSLFGQQSGGGLPAVSRAPRGRQWEWLPMLPPQAGPPRDAHPSVGAAETPVPGLGGLILPI